MTYPKKSVCIGLGAVALLAISVIARADSLSATMPVSMSVQSACSSINATPMTFPTSSVGNKNIDATATLTVQCNNGVVYDIGASLGDHGVGGANPLRYMSSGQAEVQYQLYLDTQRTQIWDVSQGTGHADASAANGQSLASGTGTGADQTSTIYGRAFVTADTPGGNYSDSVVVTLLF